MRGWYSLKSLFVVLTLVCASDAMRSVVFAAKPETRTYQIVATDEFVTSCGSFFILQTSVTDVTETVFFDDDGTATRMRLHGIFRGTLTNSETGATVTDFPDPQNVWFDLVNGGFVAHGLFFRVHLPGEGNVVVNAGTVAVAPDGTTTLHGKHTILQEGFGVLCDALD